MSVLESAVSCPPKPSVRTIARSAAQLETFSTEGPDAGPGPNRTESPQPVLPSPVIVPHPLDPSPPSPQSQLVPKLRIELASISLPTLFYRLEACSPWRPAAGTDRHENHTLPSDLQGRQRRTDTARAAVLLRRQRPYLRTS
ncbi:hypothetical protein AVEN_145465-1 [Araneus ventricosus]|uniref:Uncharacterized protein n=1 Tax=Araneus ventricosus TaxID=182803 RepID=A0A4Y2S480_ARAVE|nr:hypothetical protein AVEN_145465-1 [Araneus ventricosus]